MLNNFRNCPTPSLSLGNFFKANRFFTLDAVSLKKYLRIFLRLAFFFFIAMAQSLNRLPRWGPGRLQHQQQPRQGQNYPASYNHQAATLRTIYEANVPIAGSNDFISRNIIQQSFGRLLDDMPIAANDINPITNVESLMELSRDSDGNFLTFRDFYTRWNTLYETINNGHMAPSIFNVKYDFYIKKYKKDMAALQAQNQHPADTNIQRYIAKVDGNRLYWHIVFSLPLGGIDMINDLSNILERLWTGVLRSSQSPTFRIENVQVQFNSTGTKSTNLIPPDQLSNRFVLFTSPVIRYKENLIDWGEKFTNEFRADNSLLTPQLLREQLDFIGLFDKDVYVSNDAVMRFFNDVQTKTNALLYALFVDFLVSDVV